MASANLVFICPWFFCSEWHFAHKTFRLVWTLSFPFPFLWCKWSRFWLFEQSTLHLWHIKFTCFLYALAISSWLGAYCSLATMVSSLINVLEKRFLWFSKKFFKLKLCVHHPRCFRISKQFLHISSFSSLSKNLLPYCFITLKYPSCLDVADYKGIMKSKEIHNLLVFKDILCPLCAMKIIYVLLHPHNLRV